MERQLEEIIAGRDENLFVVMLIYVVYFFFVKFARSDIFKPLENQILTTAKSLVYAKCYDFARNLRFALVHPFDWGIINYNNKIIFLLPDNSTEYGCTTGTVAGAVFQDYQPHSLNINCFGTTYNTLLEIAKNLPYEKVKIMSDQTSIDYTTVTAIQVINELLREGVFTFGGMRK